MENERLGSIWELKTKVSNRVFENYDFSNVDFNSAIFENVSFANCIFFKSNLVGSRLFYNSNFDSCQFRNVNFSNSTFGSHNGIYKNCLFDKSIFKGKEFNFTKFISCEFTKTKFKSINFNGSRFIGCKFSGDFNDVAFNGIYDTNPVREECLNDVDFSEAIFGDFVSFYNCNLSTCIPPKGRTFDEILYNIYSDDSSVLSTGSKDKIVLTRK
jgi:uncharacterized protein YjbI with pentapeptide repeats